MWVVVILMVQVGTIGGLALLLFAPEPFFAAAKMFPALIGQLGALGGAFHSTSLQRTQGNPHLPHERELFHTHGSFVRDNSSYSFDHCEAELNLTTDESILWTSGQPRSFAVHVFSGWSQTLLHPCCL